MLIGGTHGLCVSRHTRGGNDVQQTAKKPRPICLSESNSENAASSTRTNSPPISSFHFPNSELAVTARSRGFGPMPGRPRRVASGRTDSPENRDRPGAKNWSARSTTSSAARASNLQPLTSNFQNLPETAERVEMSVSYRKQTSGHAATRDNSASVQCSEIFWAVAAFQAAKRIPSAQTAFREARTLIASKVANDLHFDSGAIEIWHWHVKSAAKSPATAIPSATRTTSRGVVGTPIFAASAPSSTACANRCAFAPPASVPAASKKPPEIHLPKAIG